MFWRLSACLVVKEIPGIGGNKGQWKQLWVTWISRQRCCSWAVVTWIGLNSFSFLIIHPRLLFSTPLFLLSVGFMLLVCILSYLKHFINPRKGHFLCGEFRVFYVFCMHLIVTKWKNKTQPYAFFLSLSILAERTGPNPRHRQFGMNCGDLWEGSWCPHWCTTAPLQGETSVRSRSSQVGSPALHYPFPSCTESQHPYPDSSPDILDVPSSEAPSLLERSTALLS